MVVVFRRYARTEFCQPFQLVREAITSQVEMDAVLDDLWLGYLVLRADQQLPARPRAAPDRRDREPGLDVDRAPPADRGRVHGIYGVSANGLLAGSGFTVGILGAAVGIHWSLGLSSVARCLGTLAAGIYALRSRPAAADAMDSNAVTPAPPVPDRKV